MSGASDDLTALIADVRHETNNALQVILGDLENLLTRDDLHGIVVSKLRRIEAEALKIRDHIARTASIRRPGD
jgi:hypothetical protein